MAGYKPLKITGNTTGLVQNREEFLLPDDAYPKLKNAYVWRERIKRKKGYQLLGRLQRNLSTTSITAGGVTTLSFNIFTIFSITEPTATIRPGSFVFTVAAPDLPATFTDNGLGGFTTAGNADPTPIPPNSINYITGDVTLSFILPTIGGGVITYTVSYYPGLPVMGIWEKEIIDSQIDQTIFFDQVYAYIYNAATNQFQEYIAGTTWNAHGATTYGFDFFYATNYWVSSLTIPGTATPLFTTANEKLFWVTNNTGQFTALADPPRITDGVTWIPFYDNATPANTPWAQINANNEYLVNFLSMLPFRGRMLTFNTWEGTNAGTSVNYFNRIRWSTIGNPFIPFAAGPPATGSWRDDIRGQGGFLDIPTNEDIVAVGFVRDNLVIYCENSTWQLRYTGRSISPFQIEKVNTELGTQSPYSAVQFDTSLVGIGDKGIVECDSYKSDRIDIKIPDFIFGVQPRFGGPKRIQGARNFETRLAFWTIPLLNEYDPRIPSSDRVFPNTRLVYNYENDSWALFSDSLTALGTFTPTTSRTWLTTHIPWVRCNFTWLGSKTVGVPLIVGGNQQGFIELLDQVTTNDPSLFIEDVIFGTPTVITSPTHNLVSGMVIQITGIPAGSPYESLNDGIFGIETGDALGADRANKFSLYTYSAVSNEFSEPYTTIDEGVYIGGGLIRIRDNFNIVSKKFNFLDQGQNIQIGYIDILMEATEEDNPGAISLFVYLDYNDAKVSNTAPENEINDYSPQTNPDTFFNSVIPTYSTDLSKIGGSKFWQRVFCATRASFITLEYTLSNSQLAGEEQTKDVQIDAQVLWLRTAGRLSPY